MVTVEINKTKKSESIVILNAAEIHIVFIFHLYDLTVIDFYSILQSEKYFDAVKYFLLVDTSEILDIQFSCKSIHPLCPFFSYLVILQASMFLLGFYA